MPATRTQHTQVRRSDKVAKGSYHCDLIFLPLRFLVFCHYDVSLLSLWFLVCCFSDFKLWCDPSYPVYDTVNVWLLYRTYMHILERYLKAPHGSIRSPSSSLPRLSLFSLVWLLSPSLPPSLSAFSLPTFSSIHLGDPYHLCIHNIWYMYMHIHVQP